MNSALFYFLVYLGSKHIYELPQNTLSMKVYTPLGFGASRSNWLVHLCMKGFHRASFHFPKLFYLLVLFVFYWLSGTRNKEGFCDTVRIF